MNYITITKALHFLGDYYHSASKTIAISKEFYDSYSIAGLGIVAHEIGHAITDKTKNVTFQFHKTLSIICRILNSLFLVVLIAALCFLIFKPEADTIYISLFITALSTIALTFILKIITIKNEKNASDLGIYLLKQNGMTKKEIKIVKRIYRAALITYIGAVFKPFTKVLNIITFGLFK